MLGLFVCGVAMLLAACGLVKSYEPFRYRLTVEVDTPQGVRTGSSVIEVTAGEVRASFGGAAAETRGEAVAVDVAPGQTLFVLLRSEASYGWAGGIMSSVTPKPDDPSISREDRFGAHIEAVRANHKLNIVPRWFPPHSSADYPVTGYPIMVRFRDIRDPKTAEIVNPDNLAASFGPGVKLRRITVQITDDPVTDNVMTRFSTQFFNDWSQFREQISHCRQVDHPLFRSAVTRINKDDFKIDTGKVSFGFGGGTSDPGLEQRRRLSAVPCEQLIPGYAGGPLRRLNEPATFQHRPVAQAGQKQRVELARWTPGSTPLTSNWGGTLTVLNGCLAVNPRGMLLLFPYGEGKWDAEREILTYNDREYAIGSPVSFHGDTVHLFIDGGKAEYQSDSPDLGKHDFGSCNGYEIFRVDSRANQTRYRINSTTP
jgi:hypothetical protein